MSKIRASGNRFLDEHGRHVLLHGINMVCKDKSRGYIGDWNDDDFLRLKRWGFNVIRLGVIWDAVEPEPGMYDREYLERLRGFIRMARRYDLYVYLDMHQDLFTAFTDPSGAVHGDGAPAWAAMTDGEVFVPSELWSDAYLFNGAVQRAFDHFWNNAPGPDGTGIQDRYAMAWHQVAAALSAEPNVIGYDLMNEPFIGTEVQEALQRLLDAYARIAAGHGAEGIGISDIAVLANPDARMEALKLVGEPERFGELMLAIAPGLQRFEKTKLMPFYVKAAQAIREADPDGILFLETNYFSNIGAPSGIEPVEGEGGVRDPQQAYGPHAYDLVTDTPAVHAADHGRVDFIFESHRQTQERLGMPMLIGEWGAYEQSRNAENAAAHIKRIFERLLCSDTYWCYYNSFSMEEYSYFHEICRGYPMATAGTLLCYRYRENGKLFEMVWEENPDIVQPTVVYLPDIASLHPDSVRLEPEGSDYAAVRAEGSNAGFLHIPSCRRGRRMLTIADPAAPSPNLQNDQSLQKDL